MRTGHHRCLDWMLSLRFQPSINALVFSIYTDTDDTTGSIAVTTLLGCGITEALDKGTVRISSRHSAKGNGMSLRSSDVILHVKISRFDSIHVFWTVQRISLCWYKQRTVTKIVFRTPVYQAMSLLYHDIINSSQQHLVKCLWYDDGTMLGTNKRQN